MKKPKIIKQTIGRFESISLPDLGLGYITAKIDTGADSCAIHCSVIKVVLKDSKPTLMVRLLDRKNHAYQNKALYFSEYRTKLVKNSFGIAEERYQVKANIKIGDYIILTDLSFAKRSKMNYPVLLGRKFLKGRFVVDVARRYVISEIVHRH